MFATRINPPWSENMELFQHDRALKTDQYSMRSRVKLRCKSTTSHYWPNPGLAALPRCLWLNAVGVLQAQEALRRFLLPIRPAIPATNPSAQSGSAGTGVAGEAETALPAKVTIPGVNSSICSWVSSVTKTISMFSGSPGPPQLGPTAIHQASSPDPILGL
jgi:hypothetical protein